MARPRSEAKRSSILNAALLEFAESGLSASTSSIAQRAEIAAGTLFTYFPSKEDLQNALYLHLKAEIYSRMNDGFPASETLRVRLHHMWTASLLWASELPAKRKVSIQLGLSDILTPTTREAASAMTGQTAQALAELERRGAAAGLPKGLATAAMSSMQDAALNLLAASPQLDPEHVSEQAFRAFWRTLSPSQTQPQEAADLTETK